MLRNGIVLLTTLTIGAALLTGCGACKEAGTDAGTDDLVSVDSSLLSGVKYDATAKTLTAKFVSGDIYEYAGVSQTLYDDFMAAESKGSFFVENIKDKLESRKL